MKDYVILLAGGSGKRMQAEIPKQFIEVKGKPIIVYTLEKFQENNQIEAVVVVCVKDWTEHLKLLLEQYKLTKVRWVIEMCIRDSSCFFQYRYDNSVGYKRT